MSVLDRPYEDRWGPRRVRIVAGALALIFTIIVGRSAFVAFNGPVKDGAGAAVAETARRADIVDRHGELLATTVPAYSLVGDPRGIWDAGEVAQSLKTVLPDLDVIDVTARLSDKSRQFVYVARNLTQRQKEAVFALGLETLRFEESSQRVYPRGKLAGHFLGYTNVDGKGLEGAELAWNDKLKKGGEALKLTLDAGVQFVLEEELEAAYKDFDMQGGAGIILDASTGAVRAIASWPAADPHKRGAVGEKAKTNRALNGRFELGSIYKPLTVAAGLEAGVLKPSDMFDVSAPIKVGAMVVKDPHPLEHAKAVSVTDILTYSSNIGAAQIAQRLGAERQKAFLGSLGLLGGVTYDGPQWASPLTPEEWDQTTLATVSYGHGLNVSPLSFAMAFTPLGNGGEFVKPVFREPIDPAQVERTRVMSTETADTVLHMMREVVLHGTGQNADAPGYQVAGKTGTAEKPGPDGYDPDRNVTSFAAVFPASRPQFVVLVVLDEAQPRTGAERTAAYTAAMITGKVIKRVAPLLDVQPVLDATVTKAGPEAVTGLRVASEAGTP